MAKVLVLDDSELIAGLMRTVLTESGHEVAISTDPDVLPSDVSPDLIVTDLVSQRPYRLEEARAWVASLRTRFPGKPVVVCTTHQAALADRDALGAAAVIGKPFEVDDLLATVARLID